MCLSLFNTLLYSLPLSSTLSTLVQIETWQLSRLNDELVSVPMRASYVSVSNALTIFCFCAFQNMAACSLECDSQTSFLERLSFAILTAHPDPVVRYKTILHCCSCRVWWILRSCLLHFHLRLREITFTQSWSMHTKHSKRLMTWTGIHAPWSLPAVSLGQRNIWGCYKSRRGSSWLGGLYSKRDWTSMA